MILVSPLFNHKTRYHICCINLMMISYLVNNYFSTFYFFLETAPIGDMKFVSLTRTFFHVESVDTRLVKPSIVLPVTII